MSEIVAEVAVQAGVLRDYFDVMTPIVDEGRIHINEEGFTIRVVDPANVALYHPVQLNYSAFEHVDVPGSVTVGANFNTIVERLSKANADEIVSVSVDMETRKLHVEYGRVDTTVALIDPDSIRQEPDSPELDLQNSVTLTGEDMNEALDLAEMVSDHVAIRASPDNKSVNVYAEGDVDDATVTFTGDDIIACDVSEEAETLVSLDYLMDLFDPIPSDSKVTLRFGEEFPVTMDWSAQNGDISAFSFLAPRLPK